MPRSVLPKGCPLIASAASFADNAGFAEFTTDNRELSSTKMFHRCPAPDKAARRRHESVQRDKEECREE
jgi:hypothetical protein